jgi:hypothetical protein
MKKIPLYSLFLLASANVFAQQTPFVQLKTQALYEVATVDNEPNINGFTAVEIFTDVVDNTIWASPEKQCVTLEKDATHTYAGDAAIHLKWDKITGGCSWVGIGFGWNGWQPKDMLDIINESAIQLQIKSVKGSFKNLPVAFAIEDYTGVQSFYGFNAGLVSGEFTDAAWRTVTIPLRNFPFEKNDADVSKVKQFMIQLEGDGDIYLDDIRIIPYDPPRP